jgi:hypothetical protein
MFSLLCGKGGSVTNSLGKRNRSISHILTYPPSYHLHDCLPTYQPILYRSVSTLATDPLSQHFYVCSPSSIAACLHLQPNLRRSISTILLQHTYVSLSAIYLLHLFHHVMNRRTMLLALRNIEHSVSSYCLMSSSTV